MAGEHPAPPDRAFSGPCWSDFNVPGANGRPLASVWRLDLNLQATVPLISLLTTTTTITVVDTCYTPGPGAAPHYSSYPSPTRLRALGRI
jgi:hypothetical protein